MIAQQLREEYDLSLDDIRWYLSTRLTESLLLDRESPESITTRIWSGKLEAELYHLEDRFLESLQDELQRGLIDERQIREHFEQARMLKFRRGR
jgi:hypothetical protein